MPNPLTREQALAFREKYRRMGEKEPPATVEEALRQFVSLVNLAFDMGWDRRLRETKDEAQRRWAKVKVRAR